MALFARRVATTPDQKPAHAEQVVVVTGDLVVSGRHRVTSGPTPRGRKAFAKLAA